MILLIFISIFLWSKNTYVACRSVSSSSSTVFVFYSLGQVAELQKRIPFCRPWGYTAGFQGEKKAVVKIAPLELVILILILIVYPLYKLNKEESDINEVAVTESDSIE